jgi:hypothetical protein
MAAGDVGSGRPAHLDDVRLTGRDSRQTRGVCRVKLPAQVNDGMAVAFPGIQILAGHKGAFLL